MSRYGSYFDKIMEFTLDQSTMCALDKTGSMHFFRLICDDWVEFCMIESVSTRSRSMHSFCLWEMCIRTKTLMVDSVLRGKNVRLLSIELEDTFNTKVPDEIWEVLEAARMMKEMIN